MTKELGVEKDAKEEKPKCGAWVEIPGAEGVKLYCNRGKHRGKRHEFFWEFHIEDPDIGQEPWQVATLTWRT